MPWDGSGNVNRTNGTNSGTTVWQDDRDDGVNIRADRHDTHDEDLAGALENTVALDGQTTTTTDNSLLWYNGTNNAFEGFEVVANRIVGRKASGDVGALTPAEGRTVLSVYSQAEVDSYSPTAVTDGGTDAFTGNFGTDVSAGETVSGDFGSANTTTTPTLENTGGTPGALTITTRDGSALWANALSGVHELQLASGGGSWLVLDPNPVSANSANAPVERDANGRAKFADPSAAQDAATKNYADTQDATFEQQRAQAWVNFNGTGTVSIRDHYNVSSITDNGTGDYTINFTSNLADANYAPAGMTNSHSSRTAVVVSFDEDQLGAGTSPAVGSLRVNTVALSDAANDAALQDVVRVCIEIFGGN